MYGHLQSWLLLFLKEAVLSYYSSVIVGKELYESCFVVCLCIGFRQTSIVYNFLSVYRNRNVVCLYADVCSTPFVVACKLMPYVVSVQSCSMLAVEYERRYRAQA